MALLLIGNMNFQDFLNIILDDHKYEIIQSDSIEDASNLFDRYRIKLDAILMHREIDPNAVDLLAQHIQKQEPLLPIIVFSFENNELLRLVKKQCKYYSHWIARDTEKSVIIKRVDRIILESKVLVFK